MKVFFYYVFIFLFKIQSYNLNPQSYNHLPYRNKNSSLSNENEGQIINNQNEQEDKKNFIQKIEDEEEKLKKNINIIVQNTTTPFKDGVYTVLGETAGNIALTAAQYGMLAYGAKKGIDYLNKNVIEPIQNVKNKINRAQTNISNTYQNIKDGVTPKFIKDNARKKQEIEASATKNLQQVNDNINDVAKEHEKKEEERDKNLEKAKQKTVFTKEKTTEEKLKFFQEEEKKQLNQEQQKIFNDSKQQLQLQIKEEEKKKKFIDLATNQINSNKNLKNKKIKEEAIQRLNLYTQTQDFKDLKNPLAMNDQEVKKVLNGIIQDSKNDLKKTNMIENKEDNISKQNKKTEKPSKKQVEEIFNQNKKLLVDGFKQVDKQFNIKPINNYAREIKEFKEKIQFVVNTISNSPNNQTLSEQEKNKKIEDVVQMQLEESIKLHRINAIDILTKTASDIHTTDLQQQIQASSQSVQKELQENQNQDIQNLNKNLEATIKQSEKATQEKLKTIIQQEGTRLKSGGTQNREQFNLNIEKEKNNLIKQHEKNIQIKKPSIFHNIKQNVSGGVQRMNNYFFQDQEEQGENDLYNQDSIIPQENNNQDINEEKNNFDNQNNNKEEYITIESNDEKFCSFE